MQLIQSFPQTQEAVAGTIASRPDLRLQLLGPQDLSQWSALRDDVLAALPDPDCYVRENDESAFLAAHCAPHGVTIGIFHEATLVAYAMLGLGAVDDPGHLGLALGMDHSGRAACAQLSSCMVHPAWRGLALQRALLDARLAVARSHGRQLCLAAVSLHNHSSRHNMLRSGMHIAWAGEFNGLQRQIMLVDLGHKLDTVPGDQRLVDSQDLAGQQLAVASGYVGVGEMRTPQQVGLQFARNLVHPPSST